MPNPCLTDSSHIVDNNLKLILGLIWTLILHYSISMPQWEDEEFDEDPNKKGSYILMFIILPLPFFWVTIKLLARVTFVNKNDHGVPYYYISIFLLLAILFTYIIADKKDICMIWNSNYLSLSLKIESKIINISVIGYLALISHEYYFFHSKNLF